MIRIHYPYKNNPKLDNKEIRGLQTQKKASDISIQCLSFGDPLGARTQDPNIKSVVLYLLS